MRGCRGPPALSLIALHAVLQAMRNFQRLQVAAVALGALCALALSTVLGRGAAPLSRAPLGLLAGAGLSCDGSACMPGLHCGADHDASVLRMAYRRCSMPGAVVGSGTGTEEVHLPGHLQAQRALRSDGNAFPSDRR